MGGHGASDGYREAVFQGPWANDGVVAGEFMPQMRDLAFTGTDYFDLLDPFFQL